MTKAQTGPVGMLVLRALAEAVGPMNLTDLALVLERPVFDATVKSLLLQRAMVRAEDVPGRKPHWRITQRGRGIIGGQQPGICRVCKCTDDRACEGGCYWVQVDLCSSCAERGAA